MKKLLIAVDSPILAEDLTKRLDGFFCVAVCYDGEAALGMIKDFRPDMIIIDLMLRALDGVSVLKTAKAAGISIQIIALTDCTSAYIVNALEKLNIQYLFRHGVDTSAIAACAVQLSDRVSTQTPVRACIEDILAELGFKMNASGTNITCIALEQYIRNPAQSLSKELYPRVASLCNGSPSQVERAIRTSIKNAWLHHNAALWQMYFALGKNGSVCKPANSDFLARISRCVQNLCCEAEHTEIICEQIVS